MCIKYWELSKGTISIGTANLGLNLNASERLIKTLYFKKKNIPNITQYVYHNLSYYLINHQGSCIIVTEHQSFGRFHFPGGPACVSRHVVAHLSGPIFEQDCGHLVGNVSRGNALAGNVEPVAQPDLQVGIHAVEHSPPT